MVQDAKDKGEDALPAGGQPSAPEGQEPSEKKEDVVLFTREEHEKIVSDRLSAQGRELASLRQKAQDRDRLAQEVETHRQQLAALQEAVDARELEALDGQPDLKAIRQRQIAAAKDLREREARIAQAEAEHSTAMAKVKALEQLELVTSIAKEFPGVEVSDLLDLGLTSEEQMRKAAEKLANAAKSAPPAIKADSLIGSGAAADWRSLPGEEKIAYGLKHPQKK